MNNQSVSKSFEQIQSHQLPRNIFKIVATVARDVKRTGRGHPLEPKQLEVAYATLHMRIHQQFGHVSKEIIDSAYANLEELLADNQSSLPSSRIRRLIFG